MKDRELPPSLTLPLTWEPLPNGDWATGELWAGVESIEDEEKRKRRELWEQWGLET